MGEGHEGQRSGLPWMKGTSSLEPSVTKRTPKAPRPTPFRLGRQQSADGSEISLFSLQAPHEKLILRAKPNWNASKPKFFRSNKPSPSLRLRERAAISRFILLPSFSGISTTPLLSSYAPGPERFPEKRQSVKTTHRTPPMSTCKSPRVTANAPPRKASPRM